MLLVHCRCWSRKRLVHISISYHSSSSGWFPPCTGQNFQEPPAASPPPLRSEPTRPNPLESDSSDLAGHQTGRWAEDHLVAQHRVRHRFLALAIRSERSDRFESETPGFLVGFSGAKEPPPKMWGSLSSESPNIVSRFKGGTKKGEGVKRKEGKVKKQKKLLLVCALFVEGRKRHHLGGLPVLVAVVVLEFGISQSMFLCLSWHPFHSEKERQKGNHNS